MKRLMSILAAMLLVVVAQAVTVSFSVGDTGAEGTAPSSLTDDSSVTIPQNFTLYLEGYTLTGWTDGTNTYAAGATVSEDASLTPVFTANSVTLSDRTEDLTFTFDFQRQNGAPTLAYQGSAGIYVTQATVAGETIDVKMDFDTSNGKIANANWNDWCQMNNGTVLTLPSCKGATFVIYSYSATTTTTIGGSTNYTTDGNTVTYQTASSDETIEIVIGDGSYFRYFQVTLPYGDVDIEEAAEYTITYSLDDSEVEGTLPTTTVTVEDGQSTTIPVNFTLYKEGYTLTGWTDGTNTYATGSEYIATADVTLTPVFTANSVTLDDRTDAVTLYWTFRRDAGCPNLAYQGSTGFLVCQAEVNGETIDVKMDFDTTSGKLNNTSWTDWAQANSGTIFTVPSCKGAVVSLEAYSNITTTTIDGQTDYTSGTTISYEVITSTETIDIVIGDGSYYRYVQVVLPVVEKSAAGTVYENEAATLYWPFSSVASYDECTATPEIGWSVTSVDLGTASMTGTGTRTSEPLIDGVTFIKVQPANGATDQVEWYAKPAAGLTFTPTKVSAYIQRFGTDAENGVTVSLQLADGTSETLGNYTAPRANQTQDVDKYGDNSNYTSYVEIELTEAQQTKLASADGISLFMTIGTGNAKQGGFSQVTLEGILDGTIADVDKYTLSAVASPEEAGTTNLYPSSEEYEDGTEVKVSVEENFGYDFINWTDDEGTVVSEDKSFTYTVERNAVLTANFTAVATYELAYSVDGGANLYMVSLTPEPTEVDGKSMYEEGTEVTLTASSNEILTFTNWSDGQSSSEITITMDGDKEYIAYYSAVDFIAAWDFYNSGSSGRVADFAAEDNDADALVLRDADGNTSGWLDKSEVGAGGYEGRPAAVNWRTTGLGSYYWQTCVNATAFTDLKVISAMCYNYNAYTTQNVEYSLDGENWTLIGTHVLEGAKNWNDGEFEVPEEANNQSAVYFRWISDTSSDIDGTSSDNDGIALGAIYILGTAELVDDGTAPVLVSSVPEAGSNTASANGKIVLTFDEKVVVADGAEATLGDKTLTPTVSGKTVIFTYKGLDYNTEYTFTLPANSVADRTYNYLAEAITITFTTRERNAVNKQLYDFIVPDDGTFQEAVAAADSRDDTSVRFRIFVKKGSYTLPYDESTTKTGSDGNAYPVPITYLSSPYVSIIGEDMDETIIKNDIYNNTAEGTAYPIEGLGNVSTLYLNSVSTNTYMQDITLWNGLNDACGRGEALRDNSNKTICKDVYLHGYQDTYCSNGGSARYYFEGGVLRGRTDYLCGKGDIFYNGVELRIVGTGGYICAPSQAKNYGYVFSDCTITGEATAATGQYYLGRPWGSGTPAAIYLNTVCEIIPSDAGWAEMSGGYPKRFAEYNTMTSTGTVVDLANRKTTFGDGYTNDPTLTSDEAAEYTLENVMGADDDWDPTYYTEQASAPEDVVLSGDTLSWADNSYVLLWAVCKDGDVVDFTIEPTYIVDDATATWSVRAANEMGGLGDATEATTSSSAITAVNAEAGSVVSTVYYNLSGIRVDESYTGTVIRVDTTADGIQTATKTVK